MFFFSHPYGSEKHQQIKPFKNSSKGFKTLMFIGNFLFFGLSFNLNQKMVIQLICDQSTLFNKKNYLLVQIRKFMKDQILGYQSPTLYSNSFKLLKKKYQVSRTSKSQHLYFLNFLTCTYLTEVNNIFSCFQAMLDATPWNRKYAEGQPRFRPLTGLQTFK